MNLFYLIVITIGSVGLPAGSSMDVTHGRLNCPNACQCEKDNYRDTIKYINIDCKKYNQENHPQINLTDMYAACEHYHTELKLIITWTYFKPTISLCELNSTCKMYLHLDTSNQEGFVLNISDFKILCPHKLTGLIMKGPNHYNVWEDRRPEHPMMSYPGPHAKGARTSDHMEPNPLCGLPMCSSNTSVAMKKRQHNWNLKILQSRGNDFSNRNSIPNDLLMNLNKLEKFNFSSNSINYISETLFSSSNLTSLSVIDLHNNKLKTIHTRLFQKLPKIHSIDLSQNWIDNLNMAFCFSTNSPLSVLNFQQNYIKTLDQKLFCNMSKFSTLNLCNNDIQNISEDTFDSVSLSNLEEIMLLENRIITMPDLNFPRSPEPKLKKIILAKNNIDNLQQINIGSFCRLPNIRFIDVSDNHITRISNGSFALKTFLYKENTNKTRGFHLDLSYNLISAINMDAFDSPVLSNLEKLNLKSNKIKKIGPSSYNWSHPGLFPVSINLRSNELTVVPIYFSQHFPSLESLDIGDNRIIEISRDTFKYGTNLKSLFLDDNKLSYIHPEAFHQDSLSKLEYVNLRGNQLVNITSETFSFSYLNSLTYLDLSENLLATLCPFQFRANINISARNNLITSIDISSLGTNDLNICEDNVSRTDINVIGHTNSNCFIDISGNNITSITNMYAEVCPECQVNMDRQIVDPSPLLNTLPQDPDLLTCEQKTFLTYVSTVLRPKFWCTCNVYYYIHLLSSVVQSDANILTEIACYKKGTSVGILGSSLVSATQGADTVDLICPVNNCSSSDHCHCTYSVQYRMTHVNCSNQNLTDFPIIVSGRGMIHINMSHNNIKHLSKTTIPLRVTHLDLSYNKLENISDALPLLTNVTHLDLSYNILKDINALNETLRLPNLKSIRLSENKFLCDCSGKTVKNVLLEKTKIITDFHAIKCFGPAHLRGKRFYSLGETEFYCGFTSTQPTIRSNETTVQVETTTNRNLVPPPKLQLSTVIASVILTVLAIILLTVIIYKYRKLLRIIIYSRFGWKFGYKYSSEKKLYDVFISYSSLDSDWVLDILLPRLENNQPPYRVSVHQRDFLPGNSILNNIAHAITNSKSVILVVSKNFLDSEWCQFEFREAVTEAIKAKYPKIVVVLLEPIKLDSDIGEELGLYLRTHTYIEWKASHFWPRLMMSLPALSTKSDTILQPSFGCKKKNYIDTYKKNVELLKY